MCSCISIIMLPSSIHKTLNKLSRSFRLLSEIFYSIYTIDAMINEEYVYESERANSKTF